MNCDNSVKALRLPGLALLNISTKNSIRRHLFLQLVAKTLAVLETIIFLSLEILVPHMFPEPSSNLQCFGFFPMGKLSYISMIEFLNHTIALRQNLMPELHKLLASNELLFRK